MSGAIRYRTFGAVGVCGSGERAVSAVSTVGVSGHAETTASDPVRRRTAVQRSPK